LDLVALECTKAIHLQDDAFEEFKAPKKPRPGSKIPEFILHLLRTEFHKNTFYTNMSSLGDGNLLNMA
jgi:hypothetical protein